VPGANRARNRSQALFRNVVAGDTDALKQNSIASVAASFSGIEAVVKEKQLASPAHKPRSDLRFY